MLVTRKSEARVDDDDLPIRLEDGEVLADLAEPAEGNDPQSFHQVEPIVAVSALSALPGEFTLPGVVSLPEPSILV